LLIGGEHEPGLLARIAVEHDNLRDASAWAASDPSRAEQALRFADALFWYWYGTGYWYGSGQFSQAREQIAQALANAPEADPLLRARALAADGLSALAQGDYEESRDSSPKACRYSGSTYAGHIASCFPSWRVAHHAG
jgi:tetratricopeptide (TPR) repeat protein